MRLYPVVAFGTMRVTHEVTQLGKYKVPAGTQIWTPFFPIHRSPQLWPEPDSFLPERWLEARQKLPQGVTDGQTQGVKSADAKDSDGVADAYVGVKGVTGVGMGGADDLAVELDHKEVRGLAT